MVSRSFFVGVFVGIVLNNEIHNLVNVRALNGCQICDDSVTVSREIQPLSDSEKGQVIGALPSTVNFVHIPKAGGTSIELIGRLNQHKCGLWGSRMVGNKTLRNKYGWTSGYWTTGIKPTPKLNGKNCVCAEWHLPPSILPLERRRVAYQEGSPTFCVVREPLAKLVSFFYYHFSGPRNVKNQTSGETHRKFIHGPCFNDTAAHMNDVLKKYLTLAMTRNPCVMGCHLLPQVAFMKSNPDDPNENLNCDRPLVLEEDLPEQFNRLMEESECEIRYPTAGNEKKNIRKEGTCPANSPMLYTDKNLHLMGQNRSMFTVDDLDKEVIELARTYYAEDFRLYEQLVRDLKLEEKK